VHEIPLDGQIGTELISELNAITGSHAAVSARKHVVVVNIRRGAASLQCARAAAAAAAAAAAGY